MRRGKEDAQAAHAAMKFLVDRLKGRDYKSHGIQAYGTFSEAELIWMDGLFTKITLQVASEVELLDIYQKAKEAQLTVHLIQDAGLTEFKGVPTYTCLAIGPDEAENIDPITKHLELR